MTNYGIEITENGVDINDALPENLTFSSQYKSLRIHSRGSGSINSASSGGLVTIAHGLTYTPAFSVQFDPGQTGLYALSPYVPTGIFGTPLLYAYADSTNLYLKAVASSYNSNFLITNNNCMYRQGGGFESDGGATIGFISGTDWDGALRFSGVAINQGTTVSSATLYFYGGDVGAGTLTNMTCKGIDEDNTDVFNNPFTRTTTTASTTINGSVPSLGNYFSIGVTSQVNEILGRAGWANGNAMGFLIRPTGAGATGYMYDANDSTNSYLNIQYSVATVANYKYTIFLNKLE